MYKNEIYKHVESGTQIRILDMNPQTGEVWTFNIANPKALPRAYATEALRNAISAKQFVVVEGADGKAVLRSPSLAAKTRRDFAFDCIAPLIATVDIFEPSSRAYMVKARAGELGCSEQTLYKYLRAWWRGGQSRNALTPAFEKIGSTGGTTGNRGRPPIYQKRPIYQMSLADHELIKSTVTKHYLKNEYATLNDAYEALLDEHYSYVDEEGKRRLKPLGESPSEMQFRRSVRKQFNREAIVRSRKGDADFELNERPVLGSLRTSTFTVGEVYEIDSTVADVHLVHPDHREKIIGKPSIYTVRDRKSNLCVGFYVGLEESSWAAAMHALVSVAEDKELLCQRYGVPYDPADWPAHAVLATTIVADRGPEMLSGASTQIAQGLDCVLQNLPARRADWKPHVECGFKQLQRSMSSVVPGYVPPESFGKRQRKDHASGAALTLHEFTALFLRAVIRQNKSAINAYPLAPKHVLEGVEPSAVNIWNIEVRERAGLLTKYAAERVRFELLPRAQASVTREGIVLGGCHYSAPEALARHWFVEASRGRFKVDVSFDRRLVDTLYIHDPHSEAGYFQATLLEKDERYRGHSFAEVECIEHLREVMRQEGVQRTRQLNVDFKNTAKAITSEAVGFTELASKGKSRSARKKDTRAAREDVRTRQRQREAAPIQANKAQERAPVTDITTHQRPSNPAGGKAAATGKSFQQKFQDLLDGK